MKRLLPLFSLFTFSISTSFAQSPNVMNNWVFGWFAGMDFSTGAPVSFNSTGMISEEGSVSYSDDQGNLLFYSNGGDKPGSGNPGIELGGVWNRDFELMPNGNITGLAGCNSSPQPALVVPKSATEYYLFTIGCVVNQTGLRKSVVDMTLDNGLGDLSVVGDVMLDPSTYSLAEGMTGTRHANGTDVWLVVHSAGGTSFYVFLVTPTGITGPVTQNVGAAGDNYGQMRFNIQGTKLAFNQELFDFDNATGVISNPVNHGQADGWGRAFSPSGKYYYQCSLMGELYQFDVEAANVAASKVLIMSNNMSAFGGMQIGPDLKIYLSQSAANALNVIEQPDMPGLSCNFVSGGFPITGGASSTMGLPNYIDSDLISLVNSVEELDGALEFNVFPNPTTDYVEFDHTPDIETLGVYAVDGRAMEHWVLVGSRLDIRALSAGVYFIRSGNSVARVIKE